MPDKQDIYDRVSFLSVIKVNNELKKMQKEKLIIIPECGTRLTN